MRWLDDEHNAEQGGIAVTVAILLVVMVGLGALVLDVGNLYWERRQLQNSADAAALAAAQDIADGNEALAEQTARGYASANNLRGAYVEGFEHDPVASTVTVMTRTGDEGSPGLLGAWLASILGHDEYFARAEATALIIGARGGSSFPVIISYCEWESFLDNPEGFANGETPQFKPGDQTIYLLDPHDNTGDCTGPSGHQAPGGWGWLDPDDSGECRAYVDEAGWVDGNTGSTSPAPANQNGCDQAFFDAIVASDKPVLLPIFEETNDLPGTRHSYKVLGFAAYQINGYRVRGGWANNAPCNNPERCFSGRFIEYITLGQYQQGDYDTFDLGVREIYLIG